jgi:hypothetical protein
MIVVRTYAHYVATRQERDSLYDRNRHPQTPRWYALDRALQRFLMGETVAQEIDAQDREERFAYLMSDPRQ